jgi:hypothetical protein
MQEKSTHHQEYAIKISNLYAGGLTLVDLAFLPMFLSSKPPDSSSQMVLITLSIALPLLVGILIVNVVETHRPYKSMSPFASRLVYLLFIIGVSTNYIGICIAIWRVCPPAGITFVITSFLAASIYSIYLAHLKEENDEEVLQGF